MNISLYKTFTYLENGEILYSQYDTIRNESQLVPGVYEISHTGFPDHRTIIKEVKLPKITKRTKTFQHKEKIDSLIKAFTKESVVEKLTSYGFRRSLGILLTGKEGTGKSSIVNYYMNELVEKRGAVVFIFDCVPQYVVKCWEVVRDIRKIQDNIFVPVFDEVEELASKEEADLKKILDGNKSIDNSITFATTNHASTIPDAIKRPSRFRYELEVTAIESSADVYQVIEPILTEIASSEEIEGYAAAWVGNTLDEIKHECFTIIMELEDTASGKPKIGYN